MEPKQPPSASPSSSPTSTISASATVIYELGKLTTNLSKGPCKQSPLAPAPSSSPRSNSSAARNAASWLSRAGSISNASPTISSPISTTANLAQYARAPHADHRAETRSRRAQQDRHTAPLLQPTICKRAGKPLLSGYQPALHSTLAAATWHSTLSCTIPHPYSAIGSPQLPGQQACPHRSSRNRIIGVRSAHWWPHHRHQRISPQRMPQQTSIRPDRQTMRPILRMVESLYKSLRMPPVACSTTICVAITRTAPPD